MGQAVLLVSARKIKTFTETNDNVDEQLLLANIQVAQDLGLQGLLGTRFFNHMLTAASGSTLTSAETILLEDYIQPYLLWRATWEALPTTPTESGVPAFLAFKHLATASSKLSAISSRYLV